ncbi:hypothetical protein EBU95_17385 [bacterium]|nr:hypothetical protein [bacterium]
MVKQILDKHKEKLNKFKTQHGMWVKASLGVIIVTVLTILDHFYKAPTILHWIFIPAGFIISVAWWYWTMSLVKELIKHKHYEIEILTSLMSEIKDIKQTIKLDKYG